MTIQRLSPNHPLLKEAIQFFWTCWGNESNFNFYEDCILHALEKPLQLPNFYILADGNDIIGTYALITNDLISRQDLIPWLACVFVKEEHRGKGLAERLLNHSKSEAEAMGYSTTYLSTDLVDFYERKGWTYFTDAHNPFGDTFKVYRSA